MKISNSIPQLFRYGIIGVSNNLAGYLLYLLITYGGLPPKIVMSFLYLIGTVIGFFANHRWVFMQKGDYFHTGVRYIIAHILGYLLNLSILIIMVDKFGYLHQWIQAIAIFMVAIFLFFMFKVFVFKSTSHSELDYK